VLMKWVAGAMHYQGVKEGGGADHEALGGKWENGWVYLILGDERGNFQEEMTVFNRKNEEEHLV